MAEQPEREDIMANTEKRCPDCDEKMLIENVPLETQDGDAIELAFYCCPDCGFIDYCTYLGLTELN